MAYESATETTLDEDKKQLASEELVLSAEISDDAENEQSDVLQALNDIKQEVIDENNIDEQKINDIVINVTNEYNLNLTNEQLDKLKELAEKFSELDYDKADFSEALQNFKDRLTGAASEIANSEETKNWFVRIWEAIVNFFKNLFSSGSEKVNELSDEAQSFFDEINTDVIPFDNQEENETPDENADAPADNQNENSPAENIEENVQADDMQNENSSADDVQNENVSDDDIQNEDSSADAVAE